MVAKNDAIILLDYLSFTVTTFQFLDNVEDYNYLYLRDRIIKKFRLGTEVEYLERRGFYGYNYSYTSGGITFCFGGRDDIFIQMSGKGCRLWESLNSGYTWFHFFKFIHGYKTCNVSRMDVACDTFALLSIDTMQQAVIKQQYVSRWQDYLLTVGNKEKGIMFGAPDSRFRLRIYDKTLERIRQLGSDVDVPKHWVRLEFQLRNESADSFIREWFQSEDISAVYFGIMRNQLKFFSKYDGIHTDRMVLKTWWDKFLSNYARIKLCYQGGLEYNLENLRNYVFGQAGSSIRTLLELSGGDVSELLDGVSHRKLNDRQRELLDRLG